MDSGSRTGSLGAVALLMFLEVARRAVLALAPAAAQRHLLTFAQWMIRGKMFGLQVADQIHGTLRAVVAWQQVAVELAAKLVSVAADHHLTLLLQLRQGLLVLAHCLLLESLDGIGRIMVLLPVSEPDTRISGLRLEVTSCGLAQQAAQAWLAAALLAVLQLVALRVVE